MLSKGATCFLVVFLSVIAGSSAAVNAADKVLEMARQVFNVNKDSLLLGMKEGLLGKEQQQQQQKHTNVLTTTMTESLAVHFDVLEITDSLGREMTSPTWQAMLRALGGDREILKRFKGLRDKFAQLEGQLTESQTVERLEELSKLSPAWNKVWSHLQNRVEKVTNLYEWFDRYQKNSEAVNERTLKDYALAVHSKDGESVKRTEETIHELVCPEKKDEDDEVSANLAAADPTSDVDHQQTAQQSAQQSAAPVQSAPAVNQAQSAAAQSAPADLTAAANHTLVNQTDSIDCVGGVFDTLNDTLTKVSSDFSCSLGKSPHQVVYDLYTLLALTDAKGYAMMQFSWMLLRLYGRGNFTIESDIARSEFEQRVIEKAHAARTVLSRLPTWMWKCDPSVANQRENETYLQFTELLHGYIVNEVDLNQDNSCKEGCSSYTNSKETSCFANQFCSKSRRCPNGRIYNCGFIEADSTVCLSNDTPNRRYDWIEYKSGRVLGQKSACDASSRSKTTANSWWRFLWHCSYCVCLCDQPGRLSDRYVSLRASLSDTANNYLVTGLRFVKKNRIVHVQIQEAVALARGQVNTTTLRWKPVEIMFITDKRKDSLDSTEDYATLRYEERALDLDDLNAPVDHVVTGVRFRKLGGNLNLEMQVSPINFTSGEINPRLSAWVGNDNTPASETKPRTKLSLKSPDVPTRSAAPSLPDSKNDQYVEFQASSLEKDVSQTTVPFLDAQPVAPQPPSWLTGVGIFHKGQPGYGGYVALRIATLNVTDYLLLPNAEFNFSPTEA